MKLRHVLRGLLYIQVVAGAALLFIEHYISDNLSRVFDKFIINLGLLCFVAFILLSLVNLVLLIVYAVRVGNSYHGFDKLIAVLAGAVILLAIGLWSYADNFPVSYHNLEQLKNQNLPEFPLKPKDSLEHDFNN